MITEALIMRVFPKAKTAIVKAIVANWQVAIDAGITTPKRVQHFFAQIGHESGGLSKTEEVLTYTSAQRIYDVFKGPKSNPRFTSVAECQSYVRQPKKLGIKVYGGRMGNKPAPSTDGYDMRGGGLMMTTGRDGYADLGFADNPAALREPVTAFKTAVREWVKRGCNALADKDDTVAIRTRINGGQNGIADVKLILARCRAVFTAEALGPVVENPALTVSEVKELQRRLAALGYTEVGRADGDVGSRTRGAILSFEKDNGLPLRGEATWDILMEVSTSTAKREVAAERATATEATVPATAKPVIDISNALRRIGIGILTTSGVGGLLNGTGDLQTVLDSTNRLKAISDAVLSLSPWLLGVGGGVAAIFVARRVVQWIVAEYREGRVL